MENSRSKVNKDILLQIFLQMPPKTFKLLVKEEGESYFYIDETQSNLNVLAKEEMKSIKKIKRDYITFTFITLLICSGIGIYLYANTLLSSLVLGLFLAFTLILVKYLSLDKRRGIENSLNTIATLSHINTDLERIALMNVLERIYNTISKEDSLDAD